MFFKYETYITIQTHPTQIDISIFLNKKIDFSGILKIIREQHKLHIPFCSDLLCNRISKVRYSTPLYILYVKADKKW